MVSKKLYMRNTVLPLKLLERLGTVVLVVALVALATTGFVLVHATPAVRNVSLFLGGMVAVLAVTALIRWVRGRTNYRWLGILGFTLLGAGAILVFFIPEFFPYMIALQVPFWYKVSWYTLPAIAIEGGILTLFITAMESGMLASFTDNEKRSMGYTFAAYAVCTVAMNFFVLDNLATVESHILWSRIVVISVITTNAFIAMYKSLSARG
jgi:dolichyl-phosphate-mannose--protein O-mannosyl transferase